MSYFNSDQRSYVDGLARISPERRCWCGWFEIDGIVECHVCPPGKTSADKFAVWCPECRNAPSPDGTKPLVHSVRCSVRKGGE